MFEMKCGDNGQYSKSKVERKFKEQYEAGVEQTWTSVWIFLFFFNFYTRFQVVVRQLLTFLTRLYLYEMCELLKKPHIT